MTAYPATTNDRPSQRPTTSSARRSGRASIACTVPVSTSDAIAGAARNAADIASTKLNMNAIRIRTWLTPMRISSSSAPCSRASTTRRSTPQPTSTTLATDSASSTHRIRRRAISRSVRPAMTRTRRRLMRRVPRSAGAVSPSRTRPRNRASSDRRAGSTACTRPPAATTAPTRSGMRSGSTGRTTSQPSSSVDDGAEGGQRRESLGRKVRHPEPHGLLAQELGQRAGGDHASLVDDRDAVAQPLHLAQEVRVEEDGRAPVAGLADDRADVVAAHGVQRGRGLVEDHQRRVAEERRREPQALLHPLGEAAGPVAVPPGQPDQRQHPVHLGAAARGRQAREARVQVQHLAGGQPGLVAEQLRQVPDPPACVPVAQRAAQHGPAPARRPGQAEQQLDGRRLAGAVGAQEAEHLARRHADVERVEGDGGPVGLAQAMGLDGGVGHGAILGRTAGFRLGVAPVS